jgi:hypothetical protein
MTAELLILRFAKNGAVGFATRCEAMAVPSRKHTPDIFGLRPCFELGSDLQMIKAPLVPLN